MKTLKFVLTLCTAVAYAAPVFAQAQDYRSPNAGSARTFLGLPIPQQWNNMRPASATQYSNSAVYYRSRYPGQNSANCVNGQCTTGNCPTGNCPTGNCPTGQVTSGYRMGDRYATGTCVNCNCPDGACASGLCATGQCPSCANGQCVGCANGLCDRGRNLNGNCPNGQCRLNQNPRFNQVGTYGFQGGWTPRTTRSNVSDSFNGASVPDDDNNWTQRPALRNPVNDLYRSHYNQSDLDLRRPYFNNQSGELNDTRAGGTSSAARDIRAPRPSDRSMSDVPADRAAGLAQI